MSAYIGNKLLTESGMKVSENRGDLFGLLRKINSNKHLSSIRVVRSNNRQRNMLSQSLESLTIE